MSLALLASACVNSSPTGAGGPLGVDEDVGRAPVLSPLSDADRTSAAARVCTPGPLPTGFAVGNDLVVATLRMSQAVYACADHVTVASSLPDDLVAGSIHATATGGVLLVTNGPPSPDLIAELERLEPETVTAFGVATGDVRGKWDVIDGTEDPSAGGADPAVSSVGAATGPLPLWIVPSGSQLTLALGPAASASGAQIIESVEADLRALDPATRSLIAEAPTARLIGRFGRGAAWQLDVVRAGMEIPGGGQLMFPGRRLVALYGSPFSERLGVLGEQSPEESLELARTTAAAYDLEPGTRVLPTFEVIATVASSDAGDDDNYSTELSIGELQPWIDAAAASDTYVVLDLQPGRTDFLTQAKRYEELFRLPHVGLALDPEWRLEPDQFHLQQVGSVTAAEVNSVSEWLAGIVREAALPQKLFLVHQFIPEMITDRETIETPPELATVIQMDGQGPLPTKYETYRIVTEGAEDATWWWGWKNFYDEDDPRATPEEVLAADPKPVFVSYQ
jgi:hypothetical protein